MCRESSFACHPIQSEIVDRLRATYSDAIFLWNALHGKEIGIIWRPKTFLPKKFAILNCKRRSAVASDSTEANSSNSAAQWTVPNVDELLSEIVHSSEGLIVNVKL